MIKKDKKISGYGHIGTQNYQCTVLLILKVCDVILCMLAKQRVGHFVIFSGGQKKLKKPLEIANYVFCLHKKISSRTFRISGRLIVIIMNVFHLNKQENCMVTHCEPVTMNELSFL
jgi:hypothetical protein